MERERYRERGWTLGKETARERGGGRGARGARGEKRGLFFWSTWRAYSFMPRGGKDRDVWKTWRRDVRLKAKEIATCLFLFLTPEIFRRQGYTPVF